MRRLPLQLSFCSLLLLLVPGALGAEAAGASPGDRWGDMADLTGDCRTLIAAMARNEQGYEDFSADIARVYENWGPDQTHSADRVTGQFKKKGLDKIFFTERAEVSHPSYDRDVYIVGISITSYFAQTKSWRRERVDYDVYAALSPSTYDCSYGGKDGDLGILIFTPKAGTEAAGIVAEIRRWIDPATGVSHRSETFSADDSWKVVVDNSDIQAFGADGPYLPLHQERFVYRDATRAHLKVTTDYSNVQLNTGLGDDVFACRADVGGDTVLASVGGGIPLFLLLGALFAALYFVGRRSARAVPSAD